MSDPASPFNLAQRVAAATAIQVAGKAVALLFALASLRIATNYLGVGGFGDFAVVLTGAALAFTTAELGLSMLLARELARDPGRGAELAERVLVLRLLVCAATFVLTAAVVPFLPYSTEVRIGLLVAVAGSLIGLVSLLPVPFFQFHLRLGRAAAAEVAVRGTALALMGLVAWLDLGFVPLVAATAAGWVAGAAVAFWLVRPYWRLRRPRRGGPSLGRLLRTAAPLGLVTILGLLHFKLDVLMLSVLQKSEDVGIYNLAYTVLEQALVIAAVFVGIVFPLLTQMLAGKDPGTRQVLDLSVRFLGLGAVVVGALAFALAGPVVELLSSEEFAESEDVLRLLVLAMPPLYVAAILANALVAAGAVRALAAVSLLALGVNAGANAFAIPAYSYTGAAVTTVASESLALVLLWLTARRVLGTAVPPVTTLARIGAAAAAAAATLAVVPGGPAVAAVAVLAVILVVAGAARVVTREDVALLLAQRRGRA